MEVAQPVGHDNGVVKSHVTFMIWRNTFEPELEINYICHPYQLPVEGAEPRNLNLADLAGIRTYVVRSEDRKAEGLFGDTLRVMLDLEEARWPYPKFLDIQVRGPERFASLGGISQIKGRTP
jgi:hypothetical protein